METIKGKAYAREMASLQLELVAMARWARHRGERIAIVLEGRDTAGKGGTAKAITEHLDTRQYRVVALPKPSASELLAPSCTLPARTTTGTDTLQDVPASKTCSANRDDMQSSTSCVRPVSSVGMTQVVFPAASIDAFSVSLPSSIVGVDRLPVS